MNNSIVIKNDRLVSVIIGVYNSEATIKEAIHSIINQTYKNIEIIVCDDGSTDNSYNILKEIKSQTNVNIIILRNDQNKGLNYTLNKCLKEANGYYIARMDADDISLPDRFEKQIFFLTTYPQYQFVSTPMIYFDENGSYGQSNPIPEPKNKDFMTSTGIFAHAPVMVTSEAFKRVGGYTESKWLIRVEDFHLWTKMYSLGIRGYNIDEPLYKMRNDINAVQRRKFKYRINESIAIALAVKSLQLPLYNYIYLFLPILKGLIPKKIYVHIHKNKIKKQNKYTK